MEGRDRLRNEDQRLFLEKGDGRRIQLVPGLKRMFGADRGEGGGPFNYQKNPCFVLFFR